MGHGELVHDDFVLLDVDEQATFPAAVAPTDGDIRTAGAGGEGGTAVSQRQAVEVATVFRL